MNEDRIPKWVLRFQGFETTSQFKAAKRRQLKNIRNAAERWRRGCAWAPNGCDHFLALERTLNAIEKDQSVGKWGR